MDKDLFKNVGVPNDDGPASPSADVLSSVSGAACQKKTFFIRLFR